MAIKKIRTEYDNPMYVETERKLNEIGKGMCLAKWTQVTPVSYTHLTLPTKRIV